MSVYQSASAPYSYECWRDSPHGDRERAGGRAAWTGIWAAVYFGACAVLLPWPPLPYPIRTIPPSLLLLGVAYPITLIVGRGPDWWHWKSERRRRCVSAP